MPSNLCYVSDHELTKNQPYWNVQIVERPTNFTPGYNIVYLLSSGTSNVPKNRYEIIPLQQDTKFINHNAATFSGTLYGIRQKRLILTVKRLLTSRLSIILFVCLFMASCNISRNYKHARRVDEAKDTTSFVDFSVRSFVVKNIEPGESKDIFALSGEGQAAYINMLKEKTNLSFTQTRDMMSQKITASPAKQDYIVQRRKVVFSIANKKYESGNIHKTIEDRIFYYKITVELKDKAGGYFSNWNKLESRYETIEIGTLSNSNSLTFGASAKIFDFGGAGKEVAGISGEYNNTQTQSMNLRERPILAGKLDKTKLEIYQEGARDMDVAGNLICDLEFNFEENENGIYFSRFSGLDSASIDSLKFEEYYVPAPKVQDIIATITINYIYREVRSGAKTSSEHDDCIKLHRKQISFDDTLIKASDISPEKYVLWTPDGELGFFQKVDEFPKRIEFATFNEAKIFLQWIQEKYKNASTRSSFKYKFTITSDALITDAQINNLLIKRAS